MTLSSHVCSESGVIVLISAMLSSPICCPCCPPTTCSSPHAHPQFVCFSHCSLSSMNSLLFAGIGVFWCWHVPALVGIVHCRCPQLHCCQHHHLPLRAVARRQGGGAIWCGVRCGSGVVGYHCCGWCHIIIVVIIIALSSRTIAILQAKAHSGGVGYIMVKKQAPFSPCEQQLTVVA